MKIYIHHGGSLIQTQYRKDQDKICAKKITCPHWWGEHDEIIKTIAHFYFFLIWRKMTTMHAIEWEHNTKQMRWCEARKKNSVELINKIENQRWWLSECKLPVPLLVLSVVEPLTRALPLVFVEFDVIVAEALDDVCGFSTMYFDLRSWTEFVKWFTSS